jgi:hypothetical protein
MSDSEQPQQPKPSRRFWQIHLSTAVFCMILSGILLLLQFKPPGELPQYYGFPLPAFDSHNAPDREALEHFSIPLLGGQLQLRLLAINVFINGLVWLFLTTWFESFIRGRAKQ